MQIFDKNGNSIIIDQNRAIASGGEGTIYEHPRDRSSVIKIYHTAKDSKLESALVELNKLPDEFIKPKTIYYDSRGKIVGFSMRYIDMGSHHLMKKLFNTTYCLKNGIDRPFKYKIYQNLRKLVEQAHSIGVTIGDLNPYNILVGSSAEVVMLDVDSYAVKGKPHNGVLLDDIRDWLQHPKIDRSTDMYAFDVLIFWMFTFMHPFRGDYPSHKTIAERVCKKSSVLSGLNIITPKCYQPFTNRSIVDQFVEVFQVGKRFIVDLAGQPVMAEAISTPAVIDSKDLYIRLIDQSISSVVASDRILAYSKNGTWYIINVGNYGVYSQMATITDSSAVFVGSSNFVYLKAGQLHYNGIPMTNAPVPRNALIFSDNGSIFIADPIDNYQMTLSIDHVMSNQILFSRNPIYTRSLTFGDGVFESIGSAKWILSFKGQNFNIIRTDFNIKNFYQRSGYVIIEHVDKNSIRYTLAKLDGLKIQIGCDLPEFKYFDVKGDFIFIPQDGKIDMINPVNDWKIVSTIDCPICTRDSRVFHTAAGMIVQSGDSVYLVNKR